MGRAENQRELAEPLPLLDAEGDLMQVGWARQPLLDANLEAAATVRPRFLQPLRLKRWDYYGVTTPSHYFSFTLADLGYAGQVFAYVVDFEGRSHHEQTLTVPLARGIVLPRNSTKGRAEFDDGQVRMHFDIERGARHISVEWPNFAGRGLQADLRLSLPADHESMVIVIPMEGKRFYYNRKVNCLPAEGEVTFGAVTHALRPAEALGNLDWGRGVWPYRSFWVWASAGGFLADGRDVGLNLGFGFGDTSEATENALILEGRVHKLAHVNFDYDPQDFTRPWQMRSPDGRVNLTFTPCIDRVASTNLLVISSEVHQLFGRYRGEVLADDGEVIHLEGLVGFAEEHQARW